MDYKSEIRKITMAEFFPAVVKMKAENWRLSQICAVSVEHGYEMSYSFCLDKKYRMVTLRLVTSRKNNAEYQNAYLDKFIGMGNLADYTRARNASAQTGPVDSDGFTVIEEEDLPFN